MSIQERHSRLEADSVEGFAFGPFRVDISARKLLRDGEPIALPSRVFDLLVCLLSHHRQVVDKDVLIKAGWADAFVSEDSLIHGISVLRRALGDDTNSPRFIATLPRRGYRFIGPVEEIRPVLDTVPSVPAPGMPVVTAATHPVARWVLVGLGVAGLIVTLATLRGTEGVEPLSASRDTIRLAQLPPKGTVLMSNAVLSPDGRQMAFVARDLLSGKANVWVRSLDSSQPTLVPGTERASKPFWSPRGDALGYFVGNNLIVASLTGDPPHGITTAIVGPNGASWGTNDVILFGDKGRGIFAVPARGGAPRQVTTIDPGSEISHAWPYFLPNGRRFLYSVFSKDPSKKGTWVGSLDPGETGTLLLPGIIGAVYAPTGHLLYAQHEMLFAVPFDASTYRLEGTPQVVARDVPEPTLPAVDPVSASGAVLSFRTASAPHQLIWFDRSGHPIETVSTPTTFRNPALSSDEQVLAVGGPAWDDAGLWLMDLNRNVSTRLEPDGQGPMISPDNSQVAYTARGGLEIRVRNLMGQANDRVVLEDDRRKTVQDWTPDGRHLLFSRWDTVSGLDLWMIAPTGSAAAAPLLVTPANERQARISPDGRWVAYTSDESGALEVYVQELPALGSKRVLSVGGGVGPSWGSGGRELFYLSTDRRLMSVEFGATGPRSPGRPVPLFNPPLAGDVWQARNYYVVSRDGRRFLFDAAADAESTPITVMVNWLNPTRPGG